MEYTEIRITWNKKSNCYLIHEKWNDPIRKSSGGKSGAKIFKISGFYIQTKWGSGDPVAVYTSWEQILIVFKEIYGVEPILEF